MDLREFSAQFGVSMIVTTANSAFRLDRSTPSQGDVEALITLAVRLVDQGFRPQSVVFEMNYRSVGVLAFLKSLSLKTGARTPEIIHASVRYLKYKDIELFKSEMEEGWGKRVIHRYLSEKIDHKYLWGESAESFEKRLEMAFHRERNFPMPTVLFIPVEGMVLLYYTKLHEVHRKKIPMDLSAWTPKPGSVLAFSADKAMVVEFDANLYRVAPVLA